MQEYLNYDYDVFEIIINIHECKKIHFIEDFIIVVVLLLIIQPVVLIARVIIHKRINIAHVTHIIILLFFPCFHSLTPYYYSILTVISLIASIYIRYTTSSVPKAIRFSINCCFPHLYNYNFTTKEYSLNPEINAT